MGYPTKPSWCVCVCVVCGVVCVVCVCVCGTRMTGMLGPPLLSMQGRATGFTD